MNPHKEPEKKQTENPWPNGPEKDGMYRILSVGINRSGISAGEIDFSINTAAVRRLKETGRIGRLIEVLDSIKRSSTISSALND